MWRTHTLQKVPEHVVFSIAETGHKQTIQRGFPNMIQIFQYVIANGVYGL